MKPRRIGLSFVIRWGFFMTEFISALVKNPYFSKLYVCVAMATQSIDIDKKMHSCTVTSFCRRKSKLSFHSVMSSLLR